MTTKRSEDELLASWESEAALRRDLGWLATATTDFETMRAEAHALRATPVSWTVRLRTRRLMESDLAKRRRPHDPWRP